MKPYLLVYLLLICFVSNLNIECNTIADLNVIVTPKEITDGNSSSSSSSSWSSILKRLDELTSSVKNNTYNAIMIRGGSGSSSSSSSKKEKEKNAFADFLLNPANFFNQTILNPANGFFKRVSNGLNSVVYSSATNLMITSKFYHFCL